MQTSMAAPAPAPAPAALALTLGYVGLVPFVLGALLVWTVWPEAHPYVTMALSAYAAMVVSFLGGVHWGVGFRIAEPPPSLFIWGVAASALAWVAVMMPPSAGLVLHGVMLGACYLVDRRVYPAHGMAQWLLMRFRLSAGATLSCFLAAAGT